MRFASFPLYLQLIPAFLLALPLTAAWEPIGPFGGSAVIVQTDPFHPDTVVAGASNGLLFRSTDAGATWQPLPFSAALKSILRAFVIEPSRPDTYLAGVTGQSPDDSGLFRTTDAGRTWHALPGLRGREVWSIAVWHRDPRVMAAGTSSGVYLTHDGGENWRLISDLSNREMSVIVSLAFDPADSNILFAGTPHLPWKTLNAGVYWSPVHAGMLDDSDVFSIQVDPAHSTNVFASACSGIYRSLNRGALWTKLTGVRSASYRTYFVALDPREEHTVFAGTTRGMIKSADDGVTWRQLSIHPSRYVAFDQHHPKRIYVATDDDGIERSDDEGDTLQAMNQGFCNRQLPSMTAGAGALYTHTIYERDSGGLFRFEAEAGQWEKRAETPRLNGQQLLDLIPDAAQPLRWYGAAYNSLLLSTDGGAAWSALAGFPKTRVSALFENPQGAYLLAATDAGLYRSPDAGKTWRKVETPSAQPLRAFFPLSDDSVAALTAHTLLFSRDGILWQAAGPLPENAEPRGIVQSGSLFAATSAGLEQSLDGGRSWQLVQGGLPASTVQAICKDPVRPDVLVVAQYDGVFESQDNGKSWSRISPDAPRFSIRQLAILPEKIKRVFALTEHQGILALPLEGTAPGASN